MEQKMNKILISSLTVLIYVIQTFSFGQEWASRYNGTGNSLDWSYAIAFDPAGNVVVTGYSTGAGTGKDYRTIKYNTSGSILWEATFNGPVNGGDYSNALAIDTSGNIYVTGRVDYGTTGADIITIKYNSSGIQQWFARFNGVANGFDEGKTIKVLNNGSVIIGGKTTGASSGLDFITIKYNSDGIQSWATIYNGPGNNEDYVVAVDVDNNGNIYAGGCSIGAGSGQDFITMKYNSSGVEQWIKRYNGAGNGGDAVVGIKVDNVGNIVTGGYTDMGSAQKFNFLTLKYDAAGNMLWEKQYDGTSNDYDFATAITIDAANNIYLTGLSTQLFGTRLDSNYATIKYDPNGNQIWISFYDGPNNSVDVSRSVFVDNNSNVYISGSSKGVGSDDDYATVKYSPSGSQVWVMSYNGTGNLNDYSSSVVADNSGNTYVTGRSFGSGSNYDFATIKYSDLVGIQPVNNQAPDKFRLSQNYPNPFNPSTKIKFDVPLSSLSERGAGGFISLKIYDVLGHEIATLVNEQLKPGTYEVNWDASNYPSGTYLYTLTTEYFNQTKRMVVLK